MRFVIGCALLLSFVASCLGTNVISRKDLRKRVRVANLFYNRFDSPLRADDFVVTKMDDGIPLVEGFDTSKKRWRATLTPALRGIWKADLYGARSYYFAGYTGVVDMAPSTWIFVIAFDDQRRPVPFYITTQDADYDRSGIKELLNLDGTGPQLLQQEWEEVNWMPNARSGYFITSLYQQRGLYWYRSDRRHGEKKYPIYEEWAMVPKAKLKMVDPSTLPQDWSTDYTSDPATGVHTRIAGLDNRGIHLGPELGCDLRSWNVVVRDSAAGRDIEAGYFHTKRPGRLLTLVSRDQMSVSLTGIKRWRDNRGCAASIIWATDPQQ